MTSWRALPWALSRCPGDGLCHGQRCHTAGGYFHCRDCRFSGGAAGGSRLSVTGPTGAFIVIIYGIVAKYGVANLLICTFMSGVMLVLMGIFRLGQVIRFFPLPLITGFTNGIAVLIFLTQLKDFSACRWKRCLLVFCGDAGVARTTG
jgi:hypothetical protein